MSLASEMNRIAHKSADDRDAYIYDMLIERIKIGASNGLFSAVVYPHELTERNVERLIEEGFKVDQSFYRISWEDEEES